MVDRASKPAAPEQTGDGEIPSRTKRYPSRKGRATRGFFQSLLVLFFLLIAGIIVIYKKNPSWFTGLKG